MFKETHPIVGTRDIRRAIEFYTQQLGFQLAFRDEADPPNYVGFRRDAVELHMQFQFEYEMGTIRLRFLIEDPDALFNEYRQRGVECTPNSVHDTPWGTREFALYDLDRNALTFYRDLTGAEKGRQSAQEVHDVVSSCMGRPTSRHKSPRSAHRTTSAALQPTHE